MFSVVRGEGDIGRLQPCRDLISRIRMDPPPRRVLDIGCGSGESTVLLAERWPDAEINGMDTSRDMLARARVAYPQGDWILGDLRNWFSMEPYDVIVASGTLQWVPEHDVQFPKMVSQLRRGGILATQMPYISGTPVDSCLKEAAGWYKWSDRFSGGQIVPNVCEPGDYYEFLRTYAARTEIWVTDYVRVLSSASQIVDMVSASMVKPYLARLEEPEREEFINRFRRKLADAYPVQSDGNILFPSRRLFVLVTR